METTKRSLVKAIIWRLLIVMLLGAMIYTLTGDWKKMTVVTIVFEIFHTVLYYVHERVWARIRWGRIKHPLEDIEIKTELVPEDREIIESKLRELGYM